MRIDNHNFIEQLYLKNEEALLYVIDEYGGLLKSVIGKNMPCIPSQQAECLNDVLLAIWNHIELFKPEKNSFKNWIAAIAKYKAIDYMRKYKKELSNVPYEVLDYREGYIDHRIENILEKELSEKTNELLSCLRAEDREILLRIYANEESIDAVSTDMSMSKAVIYNRISRAKKKLREWKGV